MVEMKVEAEQRLGIVEFGYNVEIASVSAWKEMLSEDTVGGDSEEI